MSGSPADGVQASVAELREAVGAWLSTDLGEPVEVTELSRLAGGASQEAWGLTAGGRRLVLRRDLGGAIYDYGVDRRREYEVLSVVARAGARVPRPLAYTADLLGRSAFVMERLDGEAIGRRLVSDARYAAVRPTLVEQLAESLATISRVELAELPFLAGPGAGETPARHELDRLQGQLDGIGEPHPALELGLRELRRHTPPTEQPGLVHGDFRTGNFLVTPDTGLTGILDWEFVHRGDPAEDLGWFCVRAWRFGADGLEAGGLAEREAFLRAYEKAGGQPVELDVLLWWELFGNVRWAVGSLAQAQRHLSGTERSVELASLGRICAEMELEVLRLLDELYGRAA